MIEAKYEYAVGPYGLVKACVNAYDVASGSSDLHVYMQYTQIESIPGTR